MQFSEEIALYISQFSICDCWKLYLAKSFCFTLIIDFRFESHMGVIYGLKTLLAATFINNL